MFDSLWPHGRQHARLPCPSPSPRAYSNSCLLSWWCHPTISSSVAPFSFCLQSFPTAWSFPMSQFFASGGQSRGNTPHYWWESQLVQPLCKTVWSFLKKLKIELPYNPAIQYVSMYLGKLKTQIWKETCTPVFIAALFGITKTWKQPKCPSIDEWTNKVWYISVCMYIYVHTHTQFFKP